MSRKRCLFNRTMPFHAALYLLAGAACMTCFPALAQELTGKTLFLRNCSACHQVDGRGIPGAFPALAANPFVQGNAVEVASVLLTGRNGMPNFSKHLTDRDLATVVSYVRSAWGNQGGEITPERVAALRAELHAGEFEPASQNNRH